MCDGRWCVTFKAERGRKKSATNKAYLLEFFLITVVGTNLLSRKIKKKTYRAYVGFYLLKSKDVLVQEKKVLPLVFF